MLLLNADSLLHVVHLRTQCWSTWLIPHAWIEAMEGINTFCALLHSDLLDHFRLKKRNSSARRDWASVHSIPNSRLTTGTKKDHVQKKHVKKTGMMCKCRSPVPPWLGELCSTFSQSSVHSSGRSQDRNWDMKATAWWTSSISSSGSDDTSDVKLWVISKILHGGTASYRTASLPPRLTAKSLKTHQLI